MSEFWQWIFAIIGVVAFLMAFPFVLQLLFGQPCIGYMYGEDESLSGDRLIKIYVMNTPVSNPLLKLLRVTRLVAQDVVISVQVNNATTGEAVSKRFCLEISTTASTKAGRISLPPSVVPVWVTLVRWQRDTKEALLLGRTKSIVLQKGEYRFSFCCEVDGKTMLFKKLGLLHVGSDAEDLHWDKQVTNTIFT